MSILENNFEYERLLHLECLKSKTKFSNFPIVSSDLKEFLSEIYFTILRETFLSFLTREFEVLLTISLFKFIFQHK